MPASLLRECRQIIGMVIALSLHISQVQQSKDVNLTIKMLI